MEKEFIAQDRESLISSLNIRRESGQFDRYFSQDSKLDPASVIVSSVSGSTIRAYHHTQYFRPLSIFRSWADIELKKFDFQTRLEHHAETIELYREFHSALCVSLQDYWCEKESGSKGKVQGETPKSVPNFGRVRKLIDLFMKHVVFLDSISTDVRDKLRKVVHVPLDHYTLKHLSGVWDLPKSKWTMGAVDKDNYIALQDLVRDIAGKSKIAAIDFDVYAWNDEHKTVPAPHAIEVAPDRLKLKRKSGKRR